MSKLPPSSLRAKPGKAPTEQGPITTASIAHTSLGNRLQLLQIPSNVIDLILNTMYNDTPTTRKPVLALARSADPPHDWIYNHQEVQELVGYYESLLVWSDATDASQESMATNREEAYLRFKENIESLIWNRQMKTGNGTIVSDDSVFENPLLINYRTEETLRNSLLNRKKVPVADLPCRRCKVKEVSKEALYTRSGDEAAVEYFVCQKCGHQWKE